MRLRFFVAFGLIALSLVATVVVACSSSTSCQKDTMFLQIALLGTTPLADTITVEDTEPANPTMQSFPHTPDPYTPGVEHTSVVVSWPGGYPADKVVHLVVRAYAGGTLLGAGTATIHTDPTCTVGDVAVNGGTTQDMAGVD